MKRARSLGPTIQSKPDFCPTCDGRRIIKRGLRKNCFRRLQIYSCKDCGGYFVSLVGLKGVKYPPRVIARTLCLYNLGHTQEEAARRIATEHRITVPRRTISHWISGYRPRLGLMRRTTSNSSPYMPSKPRARRPPPEIALRVAQVTHSVRDGLEASQNRPRGSVSRSERQTAAPQAQEPQRPCQSLRGVWNPPRPSTTVLRHRVACNKTPLPPLASTLATDLKQSTAEGILPPGIFFCPRLRFRLN